MTNAVASNLPQIIEAGSKSALALLALIICVLGILAAVLFRRASDKIKLLLFCLILFSFGTALYVSYQDWREDRATNLTSKEQSIKILAVDSFIRRYDKTSQLTNAHRISEIVNDLGRSDDVNLDVEHMLVSKNFDGHDDIISKNPDLIIIHMSTFFSSENKKIDLVEYAASNSEFRNFVQYMFKHRPGLKILVYTRTPPSEGVWDKRTHRAVLESVETQRLFLKGFGSNAALVELPWSARFDQAPVILAIKEGVRSILGLR